MMEHECSNQDCDMDHHCPCRNDGENAVAVVALSALLAVVFLGLYLLLVA